MPICDAFADALPRGAESGDGLLRRAVRRGRDARASARAASSSPAATTIRRRSRRWRSMGFADPAQGHRRPCASGTMAAIAATRAAAARAHLTELLPALLKTIGERRQCRRGAGAVRRFPVAAAGAACSSSRCCASTSSCGACWSRCMASAPRMAEAVIHRAHVMDGLIDPAFADEVSRRAAAGRQGRRVPRRGARLSGGHRPRPHHRAGAEVPDRGGPALGHHRARRGQGSSSPRSPRRCCSRLFAAVRREFEKRHGVVPGARAALLGFGKMASREMTVTSDLDFIMLYDAGRGRRVERREAAGGEPVLCAADPAAGRGGDRADRRGRALRGRHAAAALGQCRAAGDEPAGLHRAITTRTPGPGSTWR